MPNSAIDEKLTAMIGESNFRSLKPDKLSKAILMLCQDLVRDKYEAKFSSELTEVGK